MSSAEFEMKREEAEVEEAEKKEDEAPELSIKEREERDWKRRTRAHGHIPCR
jgi:hypothetical protein